MTKKSAEHETGTTTNTRPRPADPVGGGGLNRLLELQRTAGNEAVAELMEQQRSPVLDVLNGGGRPLDEDVRADMEARLGADFGDVRIHTDTDAHDSAVSVNAYAYTVGSDIVFQRDAYNPNSTTGRTTLAHELTHVIQQRSGPVDGSPTDGGIRDSDPDDRYEREAAATADRAIGVSDASSAQSQTSDRATGHGSAVVQRAAVKQKRDRASAIEEAADEAAPTEEWNLDIDAVAQERQLLGVADELLARIHEVAEALKEEAKSERLDVATDLLELVHVALSAGAASARRKAGQEIREKLTQGGLGLVAVSTVKTQEASIAIAASCRIYLTTMEKVARWNKMAERAATYARALEKFESHVKGAERFMMVLDLAHDASVLLNARAKSDDKVDAGVDVGKIGGTELVELAAGGTFAAAFAAAVTITWLETKWLFHEVGGAVGGIMTGEIRDGFKNLRYKGDELARRVNADREICEHAARATSPEDKAAAELAMHERRFGLANATVEMANAWLSAPHALAVRLHEAKLDEPIHTYAEKWQTTDLPTLVRVAAAVLAAAALAAQDFEGIARQHARDLGWQPSEPTADAPAPE